MKCPQCGCTTIPVKNSRVHVPKKFLWVTENGHYRRRRCAVCPHTWSTLEVSLTELENLDKKFIDKLLKQLEKL